MYQDGEVYTFRSDRAPRPAARGHRPALPELSRFEPPAAGDRVARLEELVIRLEANLTELSGRVAQMGAQVSQLNGHVSQLGGRVSQLNGQVSQLAEAVDEVQAAGAVDLLAVEAARPEAAVYDPEAPIRVEPVRIETIEQRPTPEAPAVKVSLFAGSATEAILGQVRVTSES